MAQSRFPYLFTSFIVACAPEREATVPQKSSEACTLETVVHTREPAQRCEFSQGVCGHTCREQTRDCVLEAVAAAKPFVALWTGNYVDGRGSRSAITGNLVGKSYSITWYSYEVLSGNDPQRGSRSVSSERILAQTCTTLLDLKVACTRAPAPTQCGKSTFTREQNLDLACIGEAERSICSEGFGDAF